MAKDKFEMVIAWVDGNRHSVHPDVGKYITLLQGERGDAISRRSAMFKDKESARHEVLCLAEQLRFSGEHNTELKRRLSRCASFAAHQDAAEGCRLVIAEAAKP